MSTPDKWNAANYPWNCPVPVRRSTFTSLKPSGRIFNVETDLARIPSFHLMKKPIPSGELLYCDLQTSAFGNIPLRAGSGRSGFYQGKYIKGCGRTPLALNWNMEDPYHNSGHLFPSAALREYLVSRYLEAKGALGTIVPCEGLLFRPLPRRLKNIADVTFPGKGRGGSSPRIDHLFQAITYKSAPFARASNFVWLLDQLANPPTPSPDYNPIQFFSFLGESLRDLTEDGEERDLPAMELLGRLYARSLERTFENLAHYFRLGVYWGSFHNNLTIDGRFLDLEVPLLFGGPFLGMFSSLDRPRIRSDERGKFTCSSFFLVAQSLRATTDFIRARMDYLLMSGLIPRPQQCELASDFLRALTREVQPRKHWLYDKRAMNKKILSLLERSLPFDARERASVRRLLDDQWKFFARCSPMPPGTQLKRVPMPPIRSEGHHFAHWYSFEFLKGHPDFEEARWLSDAFQKAESCKSLDKLFQSIADIEKGIQALD